MNMYMKKGSCHINDAETWGICGMKLTENIVQLMGYDTLTGLLIFHPCWPAIHMAAPRKLGMTV